MRTRALNTTPDHSERFCLHYSQNNQWALLPGSIQAQSDSLLWKRKGKAEAIYCLPLFASSFCEGLYGPQFGAFPLILGGQAWRWSLGIIIIPEPPLPRPCYHSQFSSSANNTTFNTSMFKMVVTLFTKWREHGVFFVGSCVQLSVCLFKIVCVCVSNAANLGVLIIFWMPEGFSGYPPCTFPAGGLCPQGG